MENKTSEYRALARKAERELNWRMAVDPEALPRVPDFERGDLP